MTDKKKAGPLPEETVQALIELGHVLRRTLNEALAEGRAKIVDGKVIPIKQNRTERKPEKR